MTEKKNKILEDIKAGKCFAKIKAENFVNRSYIYKIAKENNLEVITGEKSVVSPIHRKLGRLLRIIRTDAEIDKKDVAKQANISTNKITQIENGTYDVTLGMLINLGKIYNVNYIKLMENAYNIE